VWETFGEFELTVRRRSSNKDSNGNQLRRVPDEDDEVPARLCTGVCLSALLCNPNQIMASPDTPQRAGEVSRVIPAVSIARGAKSISASAKTVVDWQDVVSTQASARARVALDDGSVLNVGSDSSIKGGEARWRSAADRVGIDIWKNPIAGAEKSPSQTGNLK